MMPICDYPEMARTALCDELQAAEFYTRMAQCAPTEAECMAVLDMARDELRHALHHTNTLNLGCITPVAPMPFMEPMPTPFFTPMPTQMPAPVTAPCPGFAPPASPFAGTPATPFMGTPVAQPAPCPGIAPLPWGRPWRRHSRRPSEHRLTSSAAPSELPWACRSADLCRLYQRTQNHLPAARLVSGFLPQLRSGLFGWLIEHTGKLIQSLIHSTMMRRGGATHRGPPPLGCHLNPWRDPVDLEKTQPAVDHSRAYEGP